MQVAVQPPALLSTASSAGKRDRLSADAQRCAHTTCCLGTCSDVALQPDGIPDELCQLLVHHGFLLLERLPRGCSRAMEG